MNPLIAALFGQNQGLDITGAVAQQGQNQLNSINAFGGLMNQRPASKIAQGSGNSRWAPGLAGLYENNPQMRPGEYDPMGVQAERRRQVQYGTQDTQDRNRLLQEQLWGNFLGKTNDMMGGRGQGPAQIGAAPVQENNSPQQGGGFGQMQGQLDQLMKMLAPAMNSMDGGQVSAEGGWTMAGQAPQKPQGPQQEQTQFDNNPPTTTPWNPMMGPQLPPGGMGAMNGPQIPQGGMGPNNGPQLPPGGMGPMQGPQMGQMQNPFPVDQQSSLSWFDQNQTPQYSVDPTLAAAFGGSQFANFQPQYTVDPNVQAGFNKQAPQNGKNFVNQDISQVLFQLMKAMNPNIQFP